MQKVIISILFCALVIVGFLFYQKSSELNSLKDLTKEKEDAVIALPYLWKCMDAREKFKGFGDQISKIKSNYEYSASEKRKKEEDVWKSMYYYCFDAHFHILQPALFRTSNNGNVEKHLRNLIKKYKAADEEGNFNNDIPERVESAILYCESILNK